jgi:hypothetical protein
MFRTALKNKTDLRQLSANRRQPVHKVALGDDDRGTGVGDDMTEELAAQCGIRPDPNGSKHVGADPRGNGVDVSVLQADHRLPRADTASS